MAKFSKLSEYIYKKSSIKNTLIFLGAFLILNLLAFPFFMNKIGTENRILDLMFGYSSETAYQTISSLGYSSRVWYAWMLASVDMIYPIVYSIFLSIGISANYKNVIKKDSDWRMINILPALALLGDISENTNILIMLNNYPASINLAAHFASVSGMIKWSTVVVSMAVIVVGVFMNLRIWIKRRKTTGNS